MNAALVFAVLAVAAAVMRCASSRQADVGLYTALFVVWSLAAIGVVVA